MNTPRSLPTHAQWHAHTSQVLLPTGIRMAYLEAGVPEGKPLVLIHGFTDSSRIWRPVIARLQRDFHIYAVDLRGFGQSGKPARFVYSMPQHAEDILAFMDAVGLRSAGILAHSMGSMIAQTVAFSAPERVDGLALASTMTHMHETPEDLLKIEAYTKMDLASMSEKELQETFLPFPENCADPDFPAGYFSTLRMLSGASLAAAWRGMSLTDNRNFLQFIKAPVLVFWGSKDDIFKEDYQEEVRRYLPNAQYVTLEGVAHEIPNEVPEILAERAGRFFAEL